METVQYSVLPSDALLCISLSLQGKDLKHFLCLDKKHHNISNQKEYLMRKITGLVEIFYKRLNNKLEDLILVDRYPSHCASCNEYFDDCECREPSTYGRPDEWRYGSLSELSYILNKRFYDKKLYIIFYIHILYYLKNNDWIEKAYNDDADEDEDKEVIYLDKSLNNSLINDIYNHVYILRMTF